MFHEKSAIKRVCVFAQFLELYPFGNFQSRKENPQKLTQLSFQDLIQDTSWEKGQHKKTSP